MIWMRKFKNRWSEVDDPTDQVIFGAKLAMKAWIDYFSFTLRECGVVKSNWIGLQGLRHRLIDPNKFHFCMVRSSGIMDDSTKSCNTQPYPGSHPSITITKVTSPKAKVDISTGHECLTRILSGSPPSGTHRVDLMWSAIVGPPVCDQDGPYPWASNTRQIGEYIKDDCNLGGGVDQACLPPEALSYGSSQHVLHVANRL
eukprot:CAMPEP_0184486408 /NCGR_PEP_ID=MMETSP0113_2-20130426/7909_1 /TAXON_ID=91329 /ORGANISM="Norrisiella sphaerica, Strain BC52" /LENGTH=199 /DNA_ID=CAMNT_0026868275 /DNA_START=468 /DNA_END=1063 /DNA_ORIENTATION=+